MNDNVKTGDELKIDQEIFDAEEFNNMMNMFNLMSNSRYMCPICLEYKQPHIIEGCYHSTCRNCLKEHIKNQSYPPKCLAIMLGSAVVPILCQNVINDDVCFEILDSEDHGLFRRKIMNSRYINNENLFPCYSPSCIGSNKGDKTSQAKCVRCGTISCYVCKDIHQPGQSCEMWATEHEDLLNNRKFQKLANEKKIENNEGMYCPKCSAFFEFIVGGCDGIICPVCQHDICYRTKQSRWGPGGRGDISGGCKCMVNGIKCHEDCKFCH